MPLSQALYIIHLIKYNGVIVWGGQNKFPVLYDEYMLKYFHKSTLISGENVAGIDLG